MPRLALSLLLSMLLVGAGGCSQQDAIQTYEVPRQAKAGPSSVAPTEEKVPSRMLAVMLPGDHQAWFLKVMAPGADVLPVAPDVLKFLRGVRFDKEISKPVWNLPEGWSELPGAGMRMATLTIPTDGEALQLSVIGLPLIGDWDAQVLDNVNRWRGQLGLPPLALAELAEESAAGLERIVSGDRESILVDLEGDAAPLGGMGGPMFGGMRPMTRSPQSPAQPAQPRKNPTPSLTYDTPNGWRELPPTGMRLANLAAGDVEQQAEVTASAMTAAMPTLSIINVWRGDAGLGAMDEGEMEAALKPIELDGGPAKLIEITPTDAKTHVIGVIGVRGPQAWLLKIRGPAETVDNERGAFRGWLQSIQFSE